MDNMELFSERCKDWGIQLDHRQEEQFLQYYEFLIEKNKVMNLTAITDYSQVLSKHFLDSLSCVRAMDLTEVKSLMDVGTGAGFPGIPLKIVFPHLKICLLDSLKKRIHFLDDVIRLLKLKDVSTVHGRAEDYGRNPDYREKYDICVSRAVSNLSTLAEYCMPFVKVGGSFISYKSGNVKEEAERSVHAFHSLGGRQKNILYFSLPGTEIERSLVVAEKIRHTPFQYPRKAGIPNKEPL